MSIDAEKLAFIKAELAKSAAEGLGKSRNGVADTAEIYELTNQLAEQMITRFLELQDQYDKSKVK